MNRVFLITVAIIIIIFSNCSDPENKTPEVSDTYGPLLVSVSISGPNKILLIFNEALNTADLTDTDHYTITNGINIISIADILIVGNNAIEITAALTSWNTGTDYSIVVTNITDTSGNIINPDYNSFVFVDQI